MKIACLKSPTNTAQSLRPQNRLRMPDSCRSVENDHQNGLFDVALYWLDPYTFQSDIVRSAGQMKTNFNCTCNPCSEPAQFGT